MCVLDGGRYVVNPVLDERIVEVSGTLPPIV
jgi:hypothetical protein